MNVLSPLWTVLPRAGDSLLSGDSNDHRTFGDVVNQEDYSLPKACGCHIFAVYTGRAIMP